MIGSQTEKHVFPLDSSLNWPLEVRGRRCVVRFVFNFSPSLGIDFLKEHAALAHSLTLERLAICVKFNIKALR